MADLDIMPYTDAGGGHAAIRIGYAEDSAVFFRGEAVDINASGVTNEAATEPDLRADPPGAVGIAAVGAQGIADSTTGSGSTADIDNFDVAYYPFEESNMFITRNMFNNSDTLTAYAITNVGDTCNLRRTATGGWGIDIGGTAGTENFIVLRLLDDNGTNAIIGGTTVSSCVFAVNPLPIV